MLIKRESNIPPVAQYGGTMNTPEWDFSSDEPASTDVYSNSPREPLPSIRTPLTFVNLFNAEPDDYTTSFSRCLWNFDHVPVTPPL